MATVVHISADYPDGMNSQKTHAVRRLVEMAPEHRHVIYSLNRVNGFGGLATLPCNGELTAIAYAAPPKGLFMASRLADVADWIKADLARRGVEPDVIHAHKLTMEGLIAAPLAKSLEARLVITIQGDTDTKIASVRRDLWGRYREAIDAAESLVSMAKWPVARLRRLLGPGIDRCQILPAVTTAERLQPGVPVGTPRLVGVFHLAPWKRKGADTIARAAQIAARQEPGLTVDLYGSGAAAEVIEVRRMLRRLDAGHRVSLLGPLEHGHVQTVLKTYAGFVMPSRRETYGLAYAEALFAGTPVLYSRDRGIDGMMAGPIPGYRCDPNDVEDVAAGMLHLVRNEARLKAELAKAQQQGELDPLRSDSVRAAYNRILQGRSAAEAILASPAAVSLT